MENYLAGCFQKDKSHSSSYSLCSEKIGGVPQESILGPRLFNDFLNGLFLYPEETFDNNSL